MIEFDGRRGRDIHLEFKTPGTLELLLFYDLSPIDQGDVGARKRSGMAGGWLAC
ncbi:hypothetical protein [Desulfosarcina cetonica]|uniref:hypothetical protein n=1 Tax=Desulfosarcina cetonica TaxID=90730 RepID=UPI0012EE7D44|nr:hypothetical protein [Desulfosarcina cetonica]